MVQNRLQNMLREYEVEKNSLKEIRIKDSSFDITLEDIKKIKEELYSLAKFGEKISQIYAEQEQFLKERQFDEEIRVKARVENFLSNLRDRFSKIKFR
jgi:t-SNARE complex subunit (syntaxin)